MLQPSAEPAGASSDTAAISGGSGGNRWPRQETMALLKIRSDMDAMFRDSTLKGPLWEEVSRKMAEMGYRRNAKKCREKFENVYKYHKRTKDTRAAKGPDKTYRFFEQLQALDTSTTGQTSSSFLPPDAAASPPVESAVPIAMAMPPPRLPPSSSRRRRKWKELLEGVVEKQEELQRKFLEAMDKRENERRIQEEAWKAEESGRLKREQEILVQERSMAAAKDAALISFLKRLSESQRIPLPPAIQIQPQPIVVGDGAQVPASSSRWPKEEVEALIRLRMGMEHKYQEGGPKGPLWEEMSAEMRRLGYVRSSKRCKEKWENINKYYKRVKDGDKKRRDESKTCPYYHLLEAIYNAKTSNLSHAAAPPKEPGSSSLPEQLYDDDED